MAVGDTHVINAAKLKVTLTEQATYGVVLTSIENLEDGSTISFVARSLFEVVLRKVQQADLFYTLNAANKSSVTIHGTEYSGDPIIPGNLYVGESPARGNRKFFHADFYYTNINGGTDDVLVHVYVNVLDNEPDRVLFSVILDQTYGTGTSTMSEYAFFWAAPAILSIAPYTSAHYINGCNGGVVTRAPNVDLVGNGTTYRFNVGTAPGGAAAQLYPATGFTPESRSQFADRMEVMYPTWMSMALSGYGNRATAGQTLYMHDELRFRARKVTDWFDGTNVLLHHAVLVESPLVVANGWGDTVQWRADSYVAVFKRVGDVLGEDVGLHYRPWALGSPNGLAVVPAKAKDRSDNGPLISRSPVFRPYFPEDDNNENGITELVADEFRMALPALADEALHPLYRMNYDLLYEYNNVASGTMPGNVGNTSSDLFAVSPDLAKKTYAEELDEYGLWTYGATVCRSPCPHDGRGLFASLGLTDQRVKNYIEAVTPGYQSVDSVTKFTRTVASRTFSGGFTKITLSGAGFDVDYFNKIYSTHHGITGGIDHATHPDHLGYITKVGSYAFPIEKQSSANFTASPPIIWVAGDRTATIAVSDSIEVRFVQSNFTPGYKPTSGWPFGTAMCGMADGIGNQGVTTGGWATQYIADLITYVRPWIHGILHVLPRHHQICFGAHGNEKPGSPDQINAWRRILAAIRSQVLANNAAPFQVWEEDGPYDWLLGLVDNHTRSSIRCDLTSSAAAWGASPLFQTVWGSFYRFGGQTGDRNGHITNFLGQPVYDAEFIGAPSAKWREAMVGDFNLGRLPSFGVYPSPDGQLGVRPDGIPAYTPFYHATEPMTVSSSMAALLARLAQVTINFDAITVYGQRVRSMVRGATTTVARNPVTTAVGHSDVFNIGIDEAGATRCPITHLMMRDHRNPRRLYAIFINPGLTARGSSYTFDPELYAGEVPLAASGYTVTRHVVSHDGAVASESYFATGPRRIYVRLEAAEVEVFEITFSSLRFIYRYDDEPFTAIDMASDQTRQHIAALEGQGARFQFGFESDYFESPIKFAAVHLRAFLVGRSETV